MPCYYLNQCWHTVNWNLRNKLQENFIQYFSQKKIYSKMSSAKCQSFFLGPNVLSSWWHLASCCHYMHIILTHWPLEDIAKFNIWVRSQRWGCLVIWFYYQLITKSGNKTALPLWPDPNGIFLWKYCILIQYPVLILKDQIKNKSGLFYSND